MEYTPLRIRELAQARGHTMASLSRATGLAYGTVQAYWKDHAAFLARPSLEKIANELAVEVGDLFARKGNG